MAEAFAETGAAKSRRLTGDFYKFRLFFPIEFGGGKTLISTRQFRRGLLREPGPFNDCLRLRAGPLLTRLAAGAVELSTGELTTGELTTGELTTGELIGLRRDVDTINDLREAARIGLGARTRALMAAGGQVIG